MAMNFLRPLLLVLWAGTLVFSTHSFAQTPEATPSTIEVDPTELELEVGESAQLKATVKDAEGDVLDLPVLFLSMSRRAVGVTPEGLVEAAQPGKHDILVRVPRNPNETGGAAQALLETRVSVTIPQPIVTDVDFVDPPARFYTGTSLRPNLQVTDASGARRSDVEIRLTSDNERVARVRGTRRVDLLQPGTATIVAKVEDATAELTLRVIDDPTRSLTLTPDTTSARAGDVIRFTAVPRDTAGQPVPEMPIQFAFRARTVDHDLGEPPSGMIAEDGRFVADFAGEYTIVAVAGKLSATETVNIVPRNVNRQIEVVGHGKVIDRRSSDLWIWEGVDGRDYAVTGTSGAEGHAYFWDVTDPGNMVIIDTVRVDARTVNDVKISADGRTAVISREGASNRRNGLVLLDVSDPQTGVQILSRYDDELTGGVHNVFIYDNHVYALSGGRRYDIINIEDPRNPYRVGRFELDTPAHAIHDVWVVDGIAYSSNWTDGVVAVDVGGGGKGGSPRNPVILGKYSYPSGWNHAAFPYRSQSTGKFYVFAGDEAFPPELNPRGVDRSPTGAPIIAAGWIHVIEFDDWQHPKEVARFQIPLAGSHNFWIEDDVLYAAFFNAGLRVVDISGELMGDLYRQGREIAFFLSHHPQGYKPNSARVWGAQPHKGNIFFTDFNSGLWAVRLAPTPTDDR